MRYRGIYFALGTSCSLLRAPYPVRPFRYLGLEDAGRPVRERNCMLDKRRNWTFGNRHPLAAILLGIVATIVGLVGFAGLTQARTDAQPGTQAQAKGAPTIPVVAQNPAVPLTGAA